MTELLTLIILVSYFTFLFLISKWTKGNEDNDTFFKKDTYGIEVQNNND